MDKRKKNGTNPKMKKSITTAVVTLAVTAGVAAGGAAYHAGVKFKPDGAKRALWANQVHFQSDSNNNKEKKEKLKDESTLISPDGQDNTTQNEVQSGYLFDDTTLPGQKQITIAEEKKDDTVNDPESSITGDYVSTVYDTTADQAQSGDVLINTDKLPASIGELIQNGLTGDKKDGETVSGTDGKKPGLTGDADSGKKPDTSGDHGKHDHTDGNQNKNPDENPDQNGDGESDIVIPPKKPAETVEDPSVSGDGKPNIADSIPSKPFEEKEITNDEEYIIMIQPDYMGAYPLYLGQKINSPETIFYALSAFAYKPSSGTVSGTASVWSKADLGKYIRIDGISFDGGQTWNDSYPIQMPDKPGSSVVIRTSCRLHESDSWQTKDVSYDPYESRIFLLSKKLSESDKQISNDEIMNKSDQYLEQDETLNLLDFQDKLLGTEKITALFPGWMENGVLVPWNYTVTSGRHILEPADMVKLSDSYTVQMKYRWMNENGTEERRSSYVALQTLTGVKASLESAKKIAVPEYVQAIDFEQKTKTGVLSIPDTVLAIADNDRLAVSESYEVSGDNPNYKAEDGILYTKDQTAIEGIPCTKKTVEIPDTITRVVIPSDNAIKSLTIDAKEAEALPDVDYTKLDQAVVVVDDSIWKDFLMKNGTALLAGDNYVAASSDTKSMYQYRSGLIITSDGVLKEAVSVKGKTLRLPEGVTSIGEGAFSADTETETLILPKTALVTFDKNCLRGSNIHTVLCQSSAQMEQVEAQLAECGAPDIQAKMQKTSSEGYVYDIVTMNNTTTVTLIGAPDTVTVFNGTIENGTITVDEIGPGAFENAKSLEWVTLGETTDTIGARAFMGCESLQGILISQKDTITVGEDAFADCEELRFVASNARTAQFLNGYDPYIGDPAAWQPSYFYVPEDAEGYGTHTMTAAVNGVTEYKLCDIGEGNMALYTQTEDTSALVRSGQTVPAEITLPKETTVICQNAFYGAKSGDGAFTLNWNELSVSVIQSGAFEYSGLGGEILLSQDEKQILLGDDAFAGCENMEKFEADGVTAYVGWDLFYGCSSLKTASFTDLTTADCEFPSAIFTGCDSLSELVLSDEVPPKMLIYGSSGYRFNYSWTKEEELEKLSIVTPDDSKEAYIRAWRYLFAGATGAMTGSEYLDLWYTVQTDLIDWDTWTIPDDEAVTAEVKNRLLKSENELRTMFGMEQVTEPAAFYSYMESDGILTLTGVPSDLTDAVLDGDTLGMPEGWYIDYIGSHAFSGAASLETLLVPDNLSGIYTDAFFGVQSDRLTLTFESETPLPLLGMSVEQPFSFGVDDAKLCIIVPHGTKAAYIDAWMYPFYGYADETDMYIAVASEFLMSDDDVEPEDVLQEMEKRISPVKERLNAIIVEQ